MLSDIFGKLFPGLIYLFATQQHCGDCDGRGQPSVTAARRARAHTHTQPRGKGLADVRGQGCCCYDAMAAAPWEAGEGVE